MSATMFSSHFYLLSILTQSNPPKPLQKTLHRNAKKAGTVLLFLSENEEHFSWKQPATVTHELYSNDTLETPDGKQCRRQCGANQTFKEMMLFGEILVNGSGWERGEGFVLKAINREHAALMHANTGWRMSSV